jgi:hypothetical protein
MNVIPDYIMKAQDIPYANEMAERLKKTLPPNLQDDDPDSEIPPQVKAQMDATIAAERRADQCPAWRFDAA